MINLVSEKYQTAYYQCTAAAGLTGDSVYEIVNVYGGTAFVTGNCLRQLYEIEKTKQIKLVRSAVEIV